MVTRADSYRHFGEECLRLNLRPLPCEGNALSDRCTPRAIIRMPAALKPPASLLKNSI